MSSGSIHPLTLVAVPPRPWALPSLPHAAQWWSGGGNNRHFVPLWHAKSVIGWQRTTLNNETATKKSEHYLYCLLTTACQIKMWNCNMHDTPWGQITHATGSDCETELYPRHKSEIAVMALASRRYQQGFFERPLQTRKAQLAGNILGWSARSEPCLRLLATASCLL